MDEPFACLSCSRKPCTTTDYGTFDICPYGVAFLNKGREIEKREPNVSLYTLARNLRHEINPILNHIVEQSTKIDSSLSVKSIDMSNPASVIIGSTVILDNFIEMITGVYEFHSSPVSISTKKINLNSLIKTYYSIYGIIKEESRTKFLKLNNRVPDSIYVQDCSDFINYIIAMLIDNAWKYSVDNSTLTVDIVPKTNELIDVKFINKSKTIPLDIDIFELGSKGNSNTKGFGYGLYWTKTLEYNYNLYLNKSDSNKFQVLHQQIKSEQEKGISIQEFYLKNLKIVG